LDWQPRGLCRWAPPEEEDSSSSSPNGTSQPRLRLSAAEKKSVSLFKKKQRNQFYIEMKIMSNAFQILYTNKQMGERNEHPIIIQAHLLGQDASNWASSWYPRGLVNHDETTKSYQLLHTNYARSVVLYMLHGSYKNLDNPTQIRCNTSHTQIYRK